MVFLRSLYEVPRTRFENISRRDRGVALKLELERLETQASRVEVSLQLNILVPEPLLEFGKLLLKVLDAEHLKVSVRFFRFTEQTL